jgi:hypothetical protein
MQYGLFEPDVLINEMWSAAQPRRAPLSSEKRLMLAVLHDAFDCYQKYLFAEDRIGQQLFAEAAAWIHSTGSRGLFSFESISETLDIEPEYFRRGLAEWHRRRVETRDALPPAAETAESTGDPAVDPMLPSRVAQR